VGEFVAETGVVNFVGDAVTCVFVGFEMTNVGEVTVVGEMVGRFLP
jgi:hypothetical protein